ncbi:MAG TPA: hypothetical protein VK645_15620 [Chitinophagaceae bacterium]|nr:hypothetical protein [Chitinophagaceae bacterium]
MKVILIATILLFSHSVNAQTNDTVGYAKKIIGGWQMLNNKDSYSKFTDTNEFDYSGGILMASYDYKVKGNMLISVNKTNGEVYTYFIEKLSSANLILKIVRTGTTLNYIRKK